MLTVTLHHLNLSKGGEPEKQSIYHLPGYLPHDKLATYSVERDSNA